MHGGIAADALVEPRRSQRQESALTGARHTQLAPVPGSVLLNIVERANTSYNHALVVALVAVVHAPVPVVHQGPVEHIVVDLLVHRHRDAVDANLQGDDTLRGRPHIATVGAHTGTGHAQQSGIFLPRSRLTVLLHGHTQNTVGAPVPLDVLEAHLIDVDILGAALGQQPLGGIQVHMACIFNCLLPIRLEVLGHHSGRLQQFWREGCRTGTLILLATNMCHDIHTIEARLCHLTLQRECTVLQHHALLLHILIHLRTTGIVDGGTLQQGILLQNTHSEGSRLPHLIAPVGMIGHHLHTDTVALNLSMHRPCTKQGEQQQNNTVFVHEIQVISS